MDKLQNKSDGEKIATRKPFNFGYFLSYKVAKNGGE